MRPAHLKSAVELAAGKPHGTRIKYMGGCRCPDCRRANTKYELRRAVLRATGRGNHLVPAEAARNHLCKLSRSGVGRRTVALCAKVSRNTIRLIKSGKKKQIRAQTEKRILKVTSADARGGSLVSAAQTWKLVNFLLDEGLTKTSIAMRLGYSRALQLNRKFVTATNARKVKALYDQIELGADYGLEVQA